MPDNAKEAALHFCEIEEDRSHALLVGREVIFLLAILYIINDGTNDLRDIVLP